MYRMELVEESKQIIMSQECIEMRELGLGVKASLSQKLEGVVS